jgi:pimeloyl-ACP methyl ester carboxylesterase
MTLLTAALFLAAAAPSARFADGPDGPVAITFAAGAPPVIVFENGLMARKEGWGPVLADIASTNAVFAYDRPGNGASHATSRPRDGATIVEDLRRLLKAQGLKPPYVLVGHSAGGLYMQIFARLHPEEVAGLVLGDPTHPRSFSGDGAIEKRGAASQIALNFFGRAARAEFDALPQTGREAEAAPPLQPSIPTVILIAPEPGADPMTAYDNRLRGDFARMYPKAQIIALTGGHQIPRTHPEALIAAIRSVLAAPRR